jgi:hypothetical protein
MKMINNAVHPRIWSKCAQTSSKSQQRRAKATECGELIKSWTTADESHSFSTTGGSFRLVRGQERSD